MFLTPEPDALLDILPIVINMGYGRDVYAAIGTCKTFWEDKYIWQVVKDMPFGGHKATPMMHAAAEGTKAHEIIKGILKRKGSLTAKDDDGSTPLFYAANANQPETVKFLHGLGADIEEPDYQGFTPLLDSSYLGNLNTVRALLDLGANMHLWDRSFGCTPFLNAARGYGVAGKQDECMELFLERGADVNEQSLFGTTALMYLAKHCWSSEDMEYLIKAGATTDQQDYDGETALHIATWNHNFSCTKILLAAGANPNARCSAGMTPLHRAAWNGNAEMTLLLLESGADARIMTNGWNTPMDFVREELDNENGENSKEQLIEYRKIAEHLFLIGGDGAAELPDFPMEPLWLADMEEIVVEEDPMWLLHAARLDRMEPYEYGWPLRPLPEIMIHTLCRRSHRWRISPNLLIVINMMKGEEIEA
jgi:hypothetical protein